MTWNFDRPIKRADNRQVMYCPCTHATTIRAVRAWLAQHVHGVSSAWRVIDRTSDLLTATEPLPSHVLCRECMPDGVTAYPHHTREWFRCELPHASDSFLSSLVRLPAARLDYDSLREITRGGEAETAFKAAEGRVRISARGAGGGGGSLGRVIRDGEELVPYRLLSDGVEFRSRFICEYRAASVEYAAEVARTHSEYEGAIRHCKKLLFDLPVALRRSHTAMQALLTAALGPTAAADPSDDGISDHDAIAHEQMRIQQEIDAQKARLVALESSPVPMLHRARFTLYRGEPQKLTLRFGRNRLGDQIIDVSRSLEEVKCIAAELALQLKHSCAHSSAK